MMRAHITTTTRKVSTLVRTVESLCRANIRTVIYPDEPRLGAFKHWLRTARLASQLDSGMIVLAQDDLIVAKGLGRALEALEWPSDDLGCLSLYLPAKYADLGQGWVRPWGFQTWGACFLLFRQQTISELINLPLAHNWPSDRGIDKFVGEGLRELGLEIRYHAPSLVQHIGETSTVCNEALAGWRVASDFVGEDFEEIIWP